MRPAVVLLLLAPFGGDLLQVIAPDLRRESPVSNKSHHVFGKQVFGGVVRPPKRRQWLGATGLPRAEERVNKRALPDAANAAVGRTEGGAPLFNVAGRDVLAPQHGELKFELLVLKQDLAGAK